MIKFLKEWSGCLFWVIAFIGFVAYLVYKDHTKPLNRKTQSKPLSDFEIYTKKLNQIEQDSLPFNSCNLHDGTHEAEVIRYSMNSQQMDTFDISVNIRNCVLEQINFDPTLYHIPKEPVGVSESGFAIVKLPNTIYEISIFNTNFDCDHCSECVEEYIDEQYYEEQDPPEPPY